MNDETRIRVDRLFSEVVDLTPRERDERMQALAEEEPEIAREIRSLLAGHAADGPLDDVMAMIGGSDGRSFFQLEAGTAVGPYRIVKEIGRGGMATVYLAVDSKHDRQVAVKVLRGDLAATLGAERFLREIGITSRLTHPHILPVFDSGEVAGLLYYVMPYIEGESLRQRLTRTGPLPVDEAIRLTEQVCSALSYAQARGIVHRDIKPANILLNGDQAVLADFGIARAVAVAGQARLTGTGLGIGTPAYVSPEQALGTHELDTRTDIYSLGCVLYEMVTGKSPFSAQGPGLLPPQLTRDPPRLRTVNAAIPLFVERAVQRATARHPEDRFSTPAEFAEAVATGTVVARLSRRQRRRWGLRGLAAAALVAVGWLVPTVLGGASVHRIAVLPLANLTNEEDYLVEGVHEALISELGQLDIPVIARASMARYQGSSRSIREIARELDAGLVVEGSLFRQGDSLEISARLYDGSSEEELWSGSYDGSLPNIVAVHRSFARAIAEEIEVALGPDDEARLRDADVVQPEVYEAYLRGMHLLNHPDLGPVSEALAHFDRAIQQNPADARAYAGLAFGYITVAHGPDPIPDALLRARAAAERSVRLDPDLAEGWAALADIHTYLTWEWEAADEAFQRANELNPSLAMNHYHRAWYLLLFDRLDESLEAHELAARIDPLTPLHTVWQPALFSGVGREQRALREARSLEGEYADNATFQFVLGQAAAEMGEIEAAIEAHEAAVALDPRWRGALARTYVLAGRTSDAMAIVRSLEAAPSPWNAIDLAQIYATLGDFDRAFEWLDYEPHHAWFPWMDRLPGLFPLRDDPRFSAWLDRLELAKYRH